LAAPLGSDPPYQDPFQSVRITRREFAVKSYYLRVVCVAALVWMSVLAPRGVSAELPGMLQSTKFGSPVAPVWYDSFDEGWRESKRRGLPMVVFITSDNCIYCDAMKKDAWCNDEVLSQLRKNFVAIRLQRDRDSAVLSRIKVPSYPMTLVASPEGKVLDHRVGYQPADQVRQLFSKIVGRQRR
jgi:Thioredoxin-like